MYYTVYKYIYSTEIQYTVCKTNDVKCKNNNFIILL